MHNGMDGWMDEGMGEWKDRMDGGMDDDMMDV